MNQRLSYEDDAYRNFINSLKSAQTRRTYSICLKIYLKYCNIEEPNKLLKNDIKLIQADIIEYITSPHVSALAYSTKYLYFSVLKHFYEMNDMVLNWKKISRYLGENERVVDDRAYSREEIQRMLAVADVRGKVIVLLLCSTGMRIGALESIFIGNLRKIEQHGIYQIKVYEKSRFSYTCFCTPECASSIESYLDYRKRCGEKLKPNAPLLREQFDKNDDIHCQHPKALTVHTLSRLLTDLLITAGIRTREPIMEGESNRIRKDVMLSHGFRKFTNTMMVKANLNLVVKEKLIGHSSFGLEKSYFRPDESLLISQYLQAAPYLTISSEHELLLKNHDIEERNYKLEKEKDDIIRLKEELEPLLALKNTLMREGILKES
jgi:integrase